MSDLKKLDSFTLEMSKNHLIHTFLRNGRLRVNPQKPAKNGIKIAKQVKKGCLSLNFMKFHNISFITTAFLVNVWLSRLINTRSINYQRRLKM